MSLSYNDLANTNNKLSILLHRLSYPENNAPEYWQKWAKQPLNDFIFALLRGLGEHQIRLTRIRREQEFMREQFQDLSNQLIIKEDIAKIEKFLHREYCNLLLAERHELAKMQDFVDEQREKVEQAIAMQQQSEATQWRQLLKQQYKHIISELKMLGLNRELAEFKNQFSEKVK